MEPFTGSFADGLTAISPVTNKPNLKRFLDSLPMKTLPKFETEYDGSLVVNGVVVAHPTPEFTREHIALAAAAPDLLAALEEVIQQHDEMLATFPNGFGWGRLISDKGRAAILAAKGGAA